MVRAAPRTPRLANPPPSPPPPPAHTQRELDDARDQLERQRRALGSAFQQQLQEAQAQLHEEARELQQVGTGEEGSGAGKVSTDKRRRW